MHYADGMPFDWKAFLYFSKIFTNNLNTWLSLIPLPLHLYKPGGVDTLLYLGILLAAIS